MIPRENRVRFINRELRKEIYKCRCLRNKFWHTPSKENSLLFKRQRNKYVSVRRKRIQGVTKKGFVSNQSFWKFVRPFITSKDRHRQIDMQRSLQKNMT